jgi:hypothetical protein
LARWDLVLGCTFVGIICAVGIAARINPIAGLVTLVAFAVGDLIFLSLPE